MLRVFRAWALKPKILEAVAHVLGVVFVNVRTVHLHNDLDESPSQMLGLVVAYSLQNFGAAKPMSLQERDLIEQVYAAALHERAQRPVLGIATARLKSGFSDSTAVEFGVVLEKVFVRVIDSHSFRISEGIRCQ